MNLEEHGRQAIRDELERVLSSPGFVRNERLSRFLRFVVERHLAGKDEEIKESLIAVEVFGRRPDYDPKVDSIVRTEAGRLRARLIEYYSGEGRGAPAIIEVPKGAYVPLFRYPAAASQRPRDNALRGVAVIVALVLAIACIGWWAVRMRNAPVRIAVLPLENRSPDQKGNDYFADGLTDEIINNLSVIEGLAVRSRTSSFAFKRTGGTVHDAGALLDVDYILEGSLARAGDQVRIQTQLVRVSDDTPLWAAKFDRDVSDVLAIQDEISQGVVNNLRLQLGRGRRRYEASIDAYDHYLRARAVTQEGPPEAFLSPARFEQVIAKDPSFAPAYAGLASVYALRSIQFPLDHPADELSKMRAAAEKALQLDPLLAEAYDALGMVDARQGRWREAEENFRRAIELDPNRSMTYDDFSVWFLSVLGRNEEALQQLRLAEKADPLSGAIHMHLGMALLSAGRYDEAATSCLKLPSDNANRIQCLGRAWLGRGRHDKAIEFLEGAPDLATNPQARGFLGHAYAKAGRREEAERLAAASRYPNEQALIFAGLGDKDRTLAALERMAVLGAQRVGLYLNRPELALLRDDPRVRTLREKAGLPSLLR